MENATQCICSLGSDRKVIDDACPNCGANVTCTYQDQGTTDFHDVYSHFCENSFCDFREHRETRDLCMSQREYLGPAPCPFCGRNVL